MSQRSTVQQSLSQHIIPQQSVTPQKSYSRRDALRMLMGAGIVGAGFLASAPVAYADLTQTEASLADAQARLDAAQAELNKIAADYEALSIKQDKTLNEIEKTNATIAALEADIDVTKKDLKARQDKLSKRVAAAYKGGTLSWIDLILSSHSFDEFTENIYYLDKISQSERELIDDVRDAKESLEGQQEEVAKHKAELDSLSATQAQQLTEMRVNQARVQDVYNGLDEEVRKLLVQRDEELEAVRQAAAAAAAAATSGSDRYIPVTGTGPTAAVLAACNTTPSPGGGLCAAWVTNVFAKAGIGWFGGNACDQYYAWCGSSDRSAIQPGMIIAVSTHPGTAAGRIYGHVGIYVGSNTVMDNVGYIRTMALDSWINYYGATVTPRWGWFGGVALS